MFTKFVGLAVFLLPFTVNLSVSNAESWQDWSQQNPTYQTPSSRSGSPASEVKSSPSSRPSTPATWSNPSPNTNPSGNRSAPTQGPSSQEYFSTQNPLFEQQFLAGCQQEQLPMSYCQCTLKEIQNAYTFNEVLQISSFMQKNGEIPSEIMQVAMKCIPG